MTHADPTSGRYGRSINTLKSKTELNQHLLKPIKPNTLAVNIKKKHEKAEISKKPENI